MTDRGRARVSSGARRRSRRAGERRPDPGCPASPAREVPRGPYRAPRGTRPGTAPSGRVMTGDERGRERRSPAAGRAAPRMP